MEDFNKADIESLPDLSGTDDAGAAPQTPETPETQSPESTEVPEGEQIAHPSTEGGEPPIETGDTETPETETGGENASPQGEAPQSPEGEPGEKPNNTDYLSEMSGGRVETAQDFEGLLSHYDELVESVKNPEMLIPEGKAREAFKYAMKFPGDNIGLANQNFHHVMSLNPETLATKDLQFEAYMLREENADLLEDRGRARALFDAEYDAKFGEELDPELDPVLHRQHELATKTASKDIEDMKAQFQSETPADANEPSLSPEEEQAYNDSLDKALNDMDGLTFYFNDNDEEGMNFVLNKENVQDFQHYVRNPNVWLQDFVGQFIDDKGSLDSEGLGQAMMLNMNSQEIVNLAYQQGRQDAGISDEEEKRNPAGEGVGTGVPAPEPETFEQAWDKAMNG